MEALDQKPEHCAVCGFQFPPLPIHGGHSCEEVLKEKIEQLDREMADLRKALGPTEPGGWDRGKAVVYISRWAQSLMRDARYLMVNLSQLAASEADLRHGLEHGMTMDEEGIDAVIDELLQEEG